MPKISIIANFYKSEKYIDKLIKSVLAQSFSDWELIAVNDCSPGRDSEILHRYAAKDSRIRVIDNKENLGISQAKKVGIDASLGEYITFIDGDDWFEKDALEKLEMPTRNQFIDLVIMNHYRVLSTPFFNYRSKRCSSPVEYDKIISYPDCFEKYYYAFLLHFNPVINVNSDAYWGKLYRSSIIKNLDWTRPENQLWEDHLFNCNVFPHVRSLYFVDYYGYNWRWGGITSGRANNILSDKKYLDAYPKIHEELIRLITKYDYQKARIPLIEKKLHLFFDYCTNMAKYPLNSKKSDEVKNFIMRCISTGAWDDTEVISTWPLSTAIKIRDVQFIYETCHQANLKLQKKQMLRRFIHWLLFPFD